jgi:hypothetical protein
LKLHHQTPQASTMNHGRMPPMAVGFGHHREQAWDRWILVACTTLFFLAVAHAADSEMSPGQYYFLKRNLEAEYAAAREVCTVQIGSARDRCIAAAIDHRKQAQLELNLRGASATVPE